MDYSGTIEQEKLPCPARRINEPHQVQSLRSIQLQCKRRHQVREFPTDVQNRPAGHQNLEVRGAFQEADQFRPGGDELLEIVEDEQHIALANMGHEKLIERPLARFRTPRRRRLRGTGTEHLELAQEERSTRLPKKTVQDYGPLRSRFVLSQSHWGRRERGVAHPVAPEDTILLRSPGVALRSRSTSGGRLREQINDPGQNHQRSCCAYRSRRDHNVAVSTQDQSLRVL
jgi:hypothetical protein